MFLRYAIDSAIPKLTDDGFIVINVKANREKSTAGVSSKRSLVVEKLAIMMEEAHATANPSVLI